MKEKVSVIEILEELESISSRNEKEKILQREENNELLQAVLKAALDPYTVYYISKFKFKKSSGKKLLEDLDSSISSFLKFADSLSKREITGNSAKHALEEYLDRVTQIEQKWFERIILKNLRIGVQSSTIEKVWPKLIGKFSVQLANLLDVKTTGGVISGINDEVKYPVEVEPKLDGFRLIAIKCDGKVSLRTRNGNELDTLPALKSSIEEIQDDNFVLDGEIFGHDWSESASVVLSNKNAKDESCMTYFVFDAIPMVDWIVGSCKLTLVERREYLSRILKKKIKRIEIVPSKTANSEKELLEFYHQYLLDSYEGAMVKKISGTYDFKRSDAVLKLKPTSTHEGVVVGWYEGKTATKWEGLFGGFEVMLPNRQITRVGTGFSDSARGKIWEAGPSSYRASIVEVEGQLLTEDGRIRFPRFKRFRDVKDVAPEVVELSEEIK